MRRRERERDRSEDGLLIGADVVAKHAAHLGLLDRSGAGLDMVPCVVLPDGQSRSSLRSELWRKPCCGLDEWLTGPVGGVGGSGRPSSRGWAHEVDLASGSTYTEMPTEIHPSHMSPSPRNCRLPDLSSNEHPNSPSERTLPTRVQSKFLSSLTTSATSSMVHRRVEVARRTSAALAPVGSRLLLEPCQAARMITGKINAAPGTWQRRRE